MKNTGYTFFIVAERQLTVISRIVEIIARQCLQLNEFSSKATHDKVRIIITVEAEHEKILRVQKLIDKQIDVHEVRVLPPECSGPYCRAMRMQGWIIADKTVVYFLLLLNALALARP